MPETPEMVERTPKTSVREIVGMSLVMLLGFGGILTGDPPMPVVFVLVTAAGSALIFAAYQGGRMDGVKMIKADIDAALAAPEEGNR